jgi:hypothetical protein
MVLCDRRGTRMPAVRATMEAKIGRAYRGLDLTLDCFPDDDVPDDPNAAIRVSLIGSGLSDLALLASSCLHVKMSR